MSDQPRNHRRLLILAAILPVTVLLAVVTEHLLLESRRRGWEDAPRSEEQVDASASPAGILDTPARMDSLHSTELVTVEKVELAADSIVLAIRVGHQQYAYPLPFLSSQGAHIINQVFGDIAITVAYCDQTDVARVYQSQGQNTAMDIVQNGMLNGELALLYHGEVHQLSQNTIPLEEHPYKLLAWSDWVEANPDGLVFPGMNWDTIEASQPDSN